MARPNSQGGSPANNNLNTPAEGSSGTPLVTPINSIDTAAGGSTAVAVTPLTNNEDLDSRENVGYGSYGSIDSPGATLLAANSNVPPWTYVGSPSLVDSRPWWIDENGVDRYDTDPSLLTSNIGPPDSQSQAQDQQTATALTNAFLGPLFGGLNDLAHGAPGFFKAFYNDYIASPIATMAGALAAGNNPEAALYIDPNEAAAEAQASFAQQQAAQNWVYNEISAGPPTPDQAVDYQAGHYAAIGLSVAGTGVGVVRGGVALLSGESALESAASIGNFAGNAPVVEPPLANSPAATAESVGSDATNSFDSIYSRAPAAKVEIDQLANEIADQFNGEVATAPIKSPERAMEKILNDYGGDATRIKDLARNTIVVSQDQIDSVAAELSARGAAVKVIDGATDPLGYSGVNATVETQAGVYGEIQVNSPEMIYAKEDEVSARSILGDDVYDSISSTTGVPGGLGHSYYEQWRVLDPASAEAQSIADLSKAYYNAVRTPYAH
jgi:hypothetical protein